MGINSNLLISEFDSVFSTAVSATAVLIRSVRCKPYTFTDSPHVHRPHPTPEKSGWIKIGYHHPAKISLQFKWIQFRWITTLQAAVSYGFLVIFMMTKEHHWVVTLSIFARFPFQVYVFETYPIAES